MATPIAVHARTCRQAGGAGVSRPAGPAWAATALALGHERRRTTSRCHQHLQSAPHWQSEPHLQPAQAAGAAAAAAFLGHASQAQSGPQQQFSPVHSHLVAHAAQPAVACRQARGSEQAPHARAWTLLRNQMALASRYAAR